MGAYEIPLFLFLELRKVSKYEYMARHTSRAAINLSLLNLSRYEYIARVGEGCIYEEGNISS
jgi:hypothetical protein